MSNNIFDKTEALISEFTEIKAHNAGFKKLYEDLCGDDLLKHYKTFTGEHRDAIMRSLEQIEQAVAKIGQNLSSASPQ